MKLARNHQSKIQSPEKTLQWAKRLRRSGKKIVFTNGCFDILHAGHVSYLESARNKGDALVVAIDTDAAVKKLKGPTRPINSLDARMQVLAGLESVDAVTWFSSGNPMPLIKKIHPDVLVKGGDWKINSILGSKEVLGWGGKVFSIRYIKGKSTTSIIQKIKAPRK